MDCLNFNQNFPQSSEGLKSMGISVRVSVDIDQGVIDAADFESYDYILASLTDICPDYLAN